MRLLGGLTTAEIARAFLVSEPTIAQRIVRAKRALAEAHVPFEVPRGAELAARLSSVLEVIYLIFNEGYSATAGEDWMRPALCEDALRLGRILAELVPSEPEVHGLVALMEIQASRSNARIGPTGQPILLLDQNRALWDQLLIRRGLAALKRSEEVGAGRGPYALQAAIAACHARARAAEETDWERIAGLYADAGPTGAVPRRGTEPRGRHRHGVRSGSRASSWSMRWLSEPSLENYHLLPSVRGDFLFKLGRFAEARVEFQRAASLTRNSRERELLLEPRPRLSARFITMCRNIKTLFNFDPPVTDEEVRAASLQFVRKISGFNKPSKANEKLFQDAVDEIAGVSARLLLSLETIAPPKNREEEAAKAKARSAERFGDSVTAECDTHTVIDPLLREAAVRDTRYVFTLFLASS